MQSNFSHARRHDDARLELRGLSLHGGGLRMRDVRNVVGVCAAPPLFNDPPIVVFIDGLPSIPRTTSINVVEEAAPFEQGRVRAAVTRSTTGWRYLSMIDCGPHNDPRRNTCMFYKDLTEETAVGVLTSADPDGLSFPNPPLLVYPNPPDLNKHSYLPGVTHNLAVLRHRGQYLMAGGLDKAQLARHFDTVGIWMTESTMPSFDGRTMANESAEFVRRLPRHKWGTGEWHALNGTHEGCRNGRSNPKTVSCKQRADSPHHAALFSRAVPPLPLTT